ncbi:MAG TPA: NmrA family NAD(P)-binding protein, partial [Pseudomonadales bacterium]|nr:NmrA family NAD(P)-binding protein [Pseudomonadales bacterium]
FLREVFFMENFTQPVMTSGAKKPIDPHWILPTIVGLLDKSTRFHMICVEDIAWFAADAFAHPELYLGKAIDIAGDSLTPDEMKQIYKKVTGRRALPSIASLTRLFVRLVNPESARQFRWNNEKGWHFPLAPLKQRHPGLIDFETFLRHYQKTK